MKRFIGFFVLEFAIVFIVSAISYWILKVPFNFFQITLSSVTAAGVIAYTLVVTGKKSN